jgi:hypothetical protein
MKHLYDRMWGRVSPVDRISRVIVAVVLLAAAAIIALSVTKEDETSRAATPAAERRERPALPMCREVEVPDDKAVGCRTSQKTLYIGAEDVPILLETTQVRVVDVRSAPRRIRVRVRLRNSSGQSQNTGKGPREVYLNVAGRQLFADPRPQQRIASGDAATVTYSFPANAAATRALRRSRGRAELAVAPFGAGGAGASKTLAVARLRVAVGPLTPRPAPTPAPAAPTAPVQPTPGATPG